MLKRSHPTHVPSWRCNPTRIIIYRNKQQHFNLSRASSPQPAARLAIEDQRRFLAITSSVTTKQNVGNNDTSLYANRIVGISLNSFASISAATSSSHTFGILVFCYSTRHHHCYETTITMVQECNWLKRPKQCRSFRCFPNENEWKWLLLDVIIYVLNPPNFNELKRWRLSERRLVD